MLGGEGGGGPIIKEGPTLQALASIKTGRFCEALACTYYQRQASCSCAPAPSCCAASALRTKSLSWNNIV